MGDPVRQACGFREESFEMNGDKDGTGVTRDLSERGLDWPHSLEEDIQGWPRFPAYNLRFLEVPKLACSPIMGPPTILCPLSYFSGFAFPSALLCAEGELGVWQPDPISASLGVSCEVPYRSELRHRFFF